MPLKLGLPLLGALLLGSAFVEGFEKTALLVVAMGVALWTAFSLPHVRREQEEPPPDEAGEGPDDGGPWGEEEREPGRDRRDEEA